MNTISNNQDNKGEIMEPVEEKNAIKSDKNINLYILAWAVVLGFFVLVGMMMLRTLPPENVGPVNQLFGALSAGFGLVLGYFFGSSKSSADKTAMLANKSEDEK